MNVRLFALAATLMASVTTIPLQTASAARTRQVPFSGNWQGGAYSNDQTGQFSHCAAYAPYKSGIAMFVAVDRQFSWRLLFTNQSWNLTVGRSIPLIITFDGRAPWTGTATATDVHAVRVEMVADSSLVQSFRAAEVMRIDASGRTFSFALSGTSRLMVDLVRCVNNSLAIERGDLPRTFQESEPVQVATRSATPPPISPSPPAAGNAVQLETEMAATRIATNLLLQAKLPNAHMLSPADTPDALKGRGAAWASDVGGGAVELLPASAGKDSPQVATSILAADAARCKGDFVSGRSSDLVDNRIVVRATSVCKDSEGARGFRYFILQGEPAGFVVYALSNPVSPSSAAPVTSLSDADFQTVAVKAAFSSK